MLGLCSQPACSVLKHLQHVSWLELGSPVSRAITQANANSQISVR